MGPWATTKGAYAAIAALASRYLANDDPLAAAANAGALLVWSSQPLYPVYVWLLVGRDAWPALLSWLSTPFFFSVPLVARKSSIGGRAWFVVTGIFNTLVSLFAFGPDAGIGWFLVACLVIAVGFFRVSEWRVAVVLGAAVLVAIATVGRLGPGLADYTPAQSRSLSHLDMWSAAVLSLYLVYAAIRAHRADHALG